MSTTTLPRPPRLGLAVLAAAAALALAPASADAMLPPPDPPTSSSSTPYPPPSAAPHAGRSVDEHVREVRRHTAKFRDPARARAHGYGLLRDAKGIACIDDPAGGMGVHLVNGDLVGDHKVRADTPEALVYEPTGHGKRLVAVEYVVFRTAWRADHPTGRPHLFGRTFELQRADNRYGLPPFFELHLWAWKHNPSGRFDDWNPRVHCP